MTTLDLDNQTCATSLKLLGDFWTLRIVDALSTGTMRYCELQRRVDNLNPVTFTDRLKKLEDAGLVQRMEKSKTGVSYCLSNRGQKILPVLEAINTFSREAHTT